MAVAFHFNIVVLGGRVKSHAVIFSKYMSTEEEKIELEVSASLRLPDINLLNKSLKFDYDFRKPENLTKKYIKSFLFKLNSFQIFNDLIELFNEIKYSHLISLCNYRFSLELIPEMKDAYIWKLKYHFENSVYRYYSYWELMGQLLNSYFDLRFEFDKKKKGIFYFKDVYRKVREKYYHKHLVSLFEIYESSKLIFDYRINKTHKINPSLDGVNIFDAVRTIMDNQTKTELRIREGYSVDKLKILSDNIYKNTLDSLETLGKFYEVGHDEVEFLDKEDPYKTVIIKLTKEEIIRINQLINKK